MPVTVKLSRAFYERLGDEIATELVEWFNAVDLAWRTDLRELNDLNFARFDAKIGERLAELRADFDTKFARAEVMEARFASVERRLDRVEAQLQALVREVPALKAAMIKYLFTFWLGTGFMVVAWFVTRWLVTR